MDEFLALFRACHGVTFDQLRRAGIAMDGQSMEWSLFSNRPVEWLAAAGADDQKYFWRMVEDRKAIARYRGG